MRLFRTIAIGVLLAALVVGIYWYYRIRPRLQSISGEHELPKATHEKDAAIRTDSSPQFDRVVDLPGDPLGLVSARGEFLIGNRKDPWGFLRLRQDGEEFEIRKQPVIETDYGQRMSFDAVTWNGREFVAIAMQSWFERGEGKVFTIHEPETLAIKSYSPAPNLVGCIAWDGASYWAATRRNTADSGEPVFLYRFNRDFQETGRFEAPGVGCQGMAWDGFRLWMTDVFSDSIYIVDVRSDPPKTLLSQETQLNYLSGIAHDGEHIWVTEYENNRMHRLQPELRFAWERSGSPESPYQAGSSPASTPAEPSMSDAETTAVYTNSFPDTGPEDMEVLEMKLESQGNALYASWRIFFGADLFANHPPSQGAAEMSMPRFVRYTINVSGTSLASTLENSYDAVAGENVESNKLLASGLEPGVYSVNVFMHAQYVNAEGTNRILNSSSASVEVAVK